MWNTYLQIILLLYLKLISTTNRAVTLFEFNCYKTYIFLRFRSPLLTKSRLIYPLSTKMFQFLNTTYIVLPIELQFHPFFIDFSYNNVLL